MTEEEKRNRALSGADPYGFCVEVLGTDEIGDTFTAFTTPFGSYANYENGMFRLTSEGSAIILNSKLIISVSGADEWTHHYICELIDLYSGQSEYNHCFGSIHTQRDLGHYWYKHPTAVIRWFEKYQNTEWYKLAETSFDSLLRMIADNSDKLSG